MKLYPISRYVGKFPKGKWEFVEEFRGTYAEAVARLRELVKADGRGELAVQYRFWDNR
jgi:hypothetical protein